MGVMIIRTLLGDITRLDAMLARLAEVLRRHGDTDDLQVRRAKAIAILADPARACLLLARTPTTSPAGDAPANDSGRSGEPAPDPDPDPRERDESDTAPGGVDGPGLRGAGCSDEGAAPGATGGCRRGPWPARPADAATIDTARELGRQLIAQGATALARLRPRTVIYLHLTAEALRRGAGVARVEGVGPVELSALRELLGHDAVVLKPVIDHRDQLPVDAYEVPASMREALGVRHPFEVFPWGTHPARTADLDHTVPYRPPDHGGPPGQTHPDNLGPLSHRHHNAKTHGGFTLEQPSPGVYLWRTPTGYWYRVDAHGSTALGRTTPDAVHRRPVIVKSPLEVELAGVLTGG
jgi:hypothetical protein